MNVNVICHLREQLVRDRPGKENTNESLIKTERNTSHDTTNSTSLPRNEYSAICDVFRKIPLYHNVP